MRKTISQQIAVACLFWTAETLGQPMLKCKDAQGQITYSNVRCEEQGLRQAGEVRDRITVLPKPAFEPAQARSRDTKGPEREAAAAERRRPVNPLIDKLSE